MKIGRRDNQLDAVFTVNNEEVPLYA